MTTQNTRRMQIDRMNVWSQCRCCCHLYL